MQCPIPLTKLSTELRRIRRLKITRPDASKPARLHEFLPRSSPRTTMSIGPLLYLSKGQRSYADRCKRGGPSHNHNLNRSLRLNNFMDRLLEDRPHSHDE